MAVNFKNKITGLPNGGWQPKKQTTPFYPFS
jgi:hypothetical protein